MDLLRPMAVIVPTTVEINVASTATLKVVYSASIISWDSSICRYQRREKPVKAGQRFSVVKGENYHIYDRKIEERDHQDHQNLPERTFSLCSSCHYSSFPPWLRISILRTAIIQKHHDHRHDHGNGASEIPFTDCNKLILNHISDQEILAAAQKLRDKEGADCRQKYQRDAVDHTGQ